MIDLQPFCANEFELRAGLQHPWRDSAWVYATNGHVIVRAPAESVQDAPLRSAGQPNNPPLMFSTWINDQPGEFLLMPPLPDSEACRWCDGNGFHTHGEGGAKYECGQCFGTKHAFTYFALGDSGFNLHYLHMLGALPECRIRTQGKKNPAAVIFSGGQALLMPMREQ